MAYLEQILFLAVILVAIFLLRQRINFIRRNIGEGKDEDRSGNKSTRIRNMLLMAFGQKKMFKNPLPAFLHLLIYVGFLVINIEVLEFIIDGLAGTHRIFGPYLGSFYTVLINIFEALAVGVLFACVVFLIRRNVIKVKRFTQSEMTSWPALDANLILIIEIILMTAILTMNATDQLLQVKGSAAYTPTGTFFFSGFMIPIFSNSEETVLIFIERFAWWFHIIGILGFAVYITYSKHLHIFMAFPNTFYANLNPRGKLQGMDAVTNEVKVMLGVEGAVLNEGEIGRFGAKDVTDLSWKNLMDAYTCTECGRCTAECPANQTGKKLSPRKIMMDVRDRLDEFGLHRDKGIDDQKSLLNDYISKEELNACTTCNACIEACPVMIDPLSIIMEMRRYIAMEESGSPSSWNAMFQNIETNFAPWKFPPSDRFNWADSMNKNDVQ